MATNQKNKKGKKGFTLVELISVIAIIGIISSIAVLAFSTISKRIKNEQYEAIVLSIKSSSGHFYESTSLNKFYVQTLIDYGLLGTDDNSKTLVDPRNDQNMNCYIINIDDTSFDLEPSSDCTKDLYEATRPKIVKCGTAEVYDDSVWHRDSSLCLTADLPQEFKDKGLTIKSYLWTFSGNGNFSSNESQLNVDLSKEVISDDYYNLHILLSDSTVNATDTQVYIKNDRRKPTLTVSEGVNCGKGSTVLYNVLEQEGESGLSSISVTGKNIDYTNNNLSGLSFNNSITINENANYKFIIKDKAGNEYIETKALSGEPIYPAVSIVVYDMKGHILESNTWSSEGIKFKIKADWGKNKCTGTVKYCIDADGGKCEPNVVVSNGELVSDYTNRKGVFYIHYLAQNIDGISTDGVFVAKVEDGKLSCVVNGESNIWHFGSTSIKYGCEISSSECTVEGENSSYVTRNFSNTGRQSSIPSYKIISSTGTSMTCPSRKVDTYIDNDEPYFSSFNVDEINDNKYQVKATAKDDDSGVKIINLSINNTEYPDCAQTYSPTVDGVPNQNNEFEHTREYSCTVDLSKIRKSDIYRFEISAEDGVGNGTGGSIDDSISKVISPPNTPECTNLYDDQCNSYCVTQCREANGICEYIKKNGIDNKGSIPKSSLKEYDVQINRSTQTTSETACNAVCPNTTGTKIVTQSGKKCNGEPFSSSSSSSCSITCEAASVGLPTIEGYTYDLLVTTLSDYTKSSSFNVVVEGTGFYLLSKTSVSSGDATVKLEKLNATGTVLNTITKQAKTDYGVGILYKHNAADQKLRVTITVNNSDYSFEITDLSYCSASGSNNFIKMDLSIVGDKLKVSNIGVLKNASAYSGIWTKKNVVLSFIPGTYKYYTHKEYSIRENGVTTNTNSNYKIYTTQSKNNTGNNIYVKDTGLSQVNGQTVSSAESNKIVKIDKTAPVITNPISSSSLGQELDVLAVGQCYQNGSTDTENHHSNVWPGTSFNYTTRNVANFECVGEVGKYYYQPNTSDPIFQYVHYPVKVVIHDDTRTIDAHFCQFATNLSYYRTFFNSTGFGNVPYSDPLSGIKRVSYTYIEEYSTYESGKDWCGARGAPCVTIYSQNVTDNANNVLEDGYTVNFITHYYYPYHHYEVDHGRSGNPYYFDCRNVQFTSGVVTVMGRKLVYENGNWVTKKSCTNAECTANPYWGEA